MRVRWTLRAANGRRAQFALESNPSPAPEKSIKLYLLTLRSYFDPHFLLILNKKMHRVMLFFGTQLYLQSSFCVL